MKKIVVLLMALAIVVPGSLFAAGGTESAPAAAPAAVLNFPEKAVEVTCLFGAGSAADLTARKLSDVLQKHAGHPFPVVNRTGGGQSVGYAHVKDAKPDGYSMVWNSNGLATAYFQGNIDFNHEDFKSVARISVEPVTIAVKADAPWKTIQEFVAFIKANPGKVRIGNSGMGTFTHLSAAAVEDFSGSTVTHVPFGKGLAFASLLGGQIEASVQLPSEVMSQYKAGQVRILAATSKERDRSIPEVPTLIESGIPLELVLWRGIAVPKDTPDAVVQRLSSLIKAAVADPEFIAFTETMAILPAYMPSDEFHAFIAKDFATTGALMKKIGTSVR